MKARLILIFFVLIQIEFLVVNARGGGGRGGGRSSGRSSGSRSSGSSWSWGSSSKSSSSSGGKGFWGSLFGSSKSTSSSTSSNTASKSNSGSKSSGGFWGNLFGGSSSKISGSSVSGNYPKQQWNKPQLYRARQPPSYKTYQQNSFAYKPPPPAYTQYPVTSFSQNAPRYPHYTYPSTSAYGNQQNYHPNGFNNFAPSPVYRSSRSDDLLTAALYYRATSGSHPYHHYHSGGYRSSYIIYSSHHGSQDSSTESPQPLPIKMKIVTTSTESVVPTFDLKKHKLFERQLVPWNEVSKTPIDLKPIPLSDSISNLPFYAYEYPTWNETITIPNPVKSQQATAASGFAKTLGDTLFALGSYYNQKTTGKAPVPYT